MQLRLSILPLALEGLVPELHSVRHISIDGSDYSVETEVDVNVHLSATSLVDKHGSI